MSKLTIVKILPAINEMFQKNIIDSEEKSCLAELCRKAISEGFDELHEKISEIYERTGSEKAREIIDLVERRNYGT